MGNDLRLIHLVYTPKGAESAIDTGLVRVWCFHVVFKVQCVLVAAPACCEGSRSASMKGGGGWVCREREKEGRSGGQGRHV